MVPIIESGSLTHWQAMLRRKPKSAIEQIKDTRLRDVQFSEDDPIETDDWVRKLVEQQIRERGRAAQKGRVKVDLDANPTPPNGR